MTAIWAYQQQLESRFQWSIPNEWNLAFSPVWGASIFVTTAFVSVPPGMYSHMLRQRRRKLAVKSE
jgi:hypothetical protein